MSDFITVLTHPTMSMAKRWELDGSITPYSTARHFKSREVPLDSFEDLAKLLKTLETSSRSCVIRGRYKGDAYAAGNDPDHKTGLAQRRKDLHDDLPHNWLLVEVDEFEPLGCDPIEDPEGAIEEFVSQLPAVFNGARCYWQLSNSAGHAKNAGKLKVHLWYWLNTQYTSEHLRAWAKATNQPIDAATLDSIQVHYTALPMFADGVDDPVPHRSGQLPGHDVDLILDAQYDVPARAKLSKRQALEAAQQSDPIAQTLFDKGMVKSVGKMGELFIDCPCKDKHTGDSSETTTLYYPANTGGYAEGHFKCLHAHCLDEPQRVFTEALGFTPDTDFEEVEDADVLPPKNELAKSIARFAPVPCHLFAAETPQRWIVKHIIPMADLIVLYGASGSGKSFVILDIAICVALGVPWRDYRCVKGRVAYVCAEGAGGFRRRLRAYALHHELDLADIDLVIVPATPNLLKGDDVRDLVRALHAAGPFVMVIIDTLAQTMAGGNENSSEDMGRAIEQCRVISTVLHSTIVLVHHTGKDDAKGARGHSSLKAAADAELEVARNGDDRALSLGKQKDGDDNIDCGFKLLQVKIGEDEDGEDITSCVVVHNHGTMANIKKRGKNKGANEMFMLDAFNELCPNPELGVSSNDLMERAIALKGEPDNARARANMKTNFNRALHALVRDNILLVEGGMVTMFEIGETL